MKVTAAVPRVHLVVRALDRNASGVLLGFSQLHRQGRIRCVLEMQVPPAPLTTGPWHLRDKDDSNIEIRVDDRRSGFIDLHDSWELNEPGLRDHDVYFKRSLDLSKHPEAARRKLEPLGLIYEVWDDGLDPFEWRRILEQVAPGGKRLRDFSRYAAQLLASWAGLGPRPNISLLSCPPPLGIEPRVLFMVGLWDPANAARHDPSRIPEFEAINRTRSGCVRQLREAFGASFYGGTQRSSFAARYAPDTLLVDTSVSSKRSYLRKVRDSAICIATTGLHGSNGCKLGEYVALSRAIVSEPLRYQVPGPFAAETHYLEFETPEQCVAQVRRLVQDTGLRQRLMRNNWDYYNGWMRPDALAMRVVDTIRERG